jgi:hypothetical protein
MTRLAAAGLVERRRRRGTFVRAITEQAVVGVLIGPSLADETAYFYRAVIKQLRSEVAAMQERSWSCRLYDGMTEVKIKPDVQHSPVYQHFVGDLRNYSFKGLIRLDGNFLNDEADEPGALLPQARLKSDVVADYYRLTYDALQYVVARGGRQVVYLRTLTNRPEIIGDLAGVSDAEREFKLPQVEVHQLQNVLAGGVLMEREAHEHTLQLIDGWQQTGRWPDALLVSDDIAARGVALAMVEKRVAVPDRLLIVTQANEGVVHHYGVPLVRYEYSPRRVAQELLGVLWKRILREPLPDLPIRVAGQLQP